MSIFVEARALAGLNYVRAGDVLAVQFVDQQKCNLIMVGGVTISCAEPAATIKARIEAALTARTETDDGHGRG